MLPGLRLRQARERLGLTYRDVERASYELAARRGRADFILHISRLADIENRGVVPGLHKLRSEEHTSELQSLTNLVCRLLLVKKRPRHRPRPRAPQETLRA